jgi:DNA-directed RNA polymerase subunit RPC12/RpoP
MKKRLTFECWNCTQTYTLYREFSAEQVLTVACPYCNAEGVVDLKPYPKKRVVMRGDKEGEPLLVEEPDLPDVLSTREPE